ncbi:MAG: methionine adenosyltransferase [Candidatus Nezhaarchaeales archaeon]
MDALRKMLVEELKQPSVEENYVEIVERKGLGHPDSICDSIVNEASIALSKEYIKRAGMVLHHNLDKGLLAAGEVEARFGGGVVKKPMLMVFGDRATFNVDGDVIPVEDIVVKAAKDWIRRKLRFVDPEHHIRYQVEIKMGSEALTDIFKRSKGILGANDTSAAVGYAPMTRTEKLVLEVEKYVNSPEFKRSYPETGEDVKVMGFREGDKLNLVMAMAFVDRFIASESEYFRRKAEVLQEIKGFLMSKSEGFSEINLSLNVLDREGRGINGVYLTVLGTSADGADCGQVGRGNRVNGVIPLNRPISSEAAAGKNPVSHVGKIYNILSHVIAQEVYDKVQGIKEVYVWLLSRIGEPIDQPMVVASQVILQPGYTYKDVEREIREIIEVRLDNIRSFCEDLAWGRINIY